MYVVDSIYSFARFPALGSSFFQSLVFIVGFLALLLVLSFLALNVSKINFFQPTRPIEWFGRLNLQQRLNNCGLCDIASARKTLVEGNDKEDSCEEKNSVEIG